MIAFNQPWVSWLYSLRHLSFPWSTFSPLLLTVSYLGFFPPLNPTPSQSLNFSSLISSINSLIHSFCLHSYNPAQFQVPIISLDKFVAVVSKMVSLLLVFTSQSIFLTVYKSKHARNALLKAYICFLIIQEMKF